MKTGITLALFFAAGVGIGNFQWHPELFTKLDISFFVLCAFLFFVGAGLGAHPKFNTIFRMARTKALLVPLATIVGTFLGVGVIGLLFQEIGMKESLAVGAGLGYYSLSSVLVAQVAGEWLGVITLLSNVVREVVTLLAAPLFVRWFGKLAPVTAGGATSMDTTLPVIVRFSGEEYAVVGLLSGFVLSVLVPFLVVLPFQI